MARPQDGGYQPTLQPSPLPQWWIRHERKPVQYLYRAMRPDGKDLKWKSHKAQQCAPDSDSLRDHVARAIVCGSRKTSPFLHTSKSFHAALRFRHLGEARRNEADSIMVRLDLYKMYDLGALSQYTLIDMSTDAARHAFFSEGADGYTRFVRNELAPMCTYAEKTREVLVKWRGNVPKEAIEVPIIKFSIFFSII